MITAPTGYSQEIRRAYLKSFSAPSPVAGQGYVVIGVEMYDPLIGYTNGTITSLNSGYNWGGNGTLTVPDITCQDDLTSYSVGTIMALNGGTGWGSDGTLTVPN